MATQTTTEPTRVDTQEEGTSLVRKGGAPPGDAPNPVWFGGSGFPYKRPGDGGDRGGGGGGREGRPPGAARLGKDPDDQSNGTKLSGKEPAIFNGDHSKAEAFLLEWTIYRLLNGEQDIMRQPFSRVMLFLTFIKGPDVQEWTSIQVG